MLSVVLLAGAFCGWGGEFQMAIVRAAACILMLSLIPVHRRTQLNPNKMITFIIFLKIAYLGREKSLSESETNQCILDFLTERPEYENFSIVNRARVVQL